MRCLGLSLVELHWRKLKSVGSNCNNSRLRSRNCCGGEFVRICSEGKQVSCPFGVHPHVLALHEFLRFLGRLRQSYLERRYGREILSKVVYGKKAHPRLITVKQLVLAVPLH